MNTELVINPPSVGDFLLLGYGNGTQAAMVVSVTGRTLGLVRFYYEGKRNMCTKPSKVRIGDRRIMGTIAPESPRAANLRAFHSGDWAPSV